MLDVDVPTGQLVALQSHTLVAIGSPLAKRSKSSISQNYEMTDDAPGISISL